MQEKQKMFEKEQEKLLDAAATIKRQAAEEERKMTEVLTKTAVQAELQKIEDDYSSTGHSAHG
jgi:hypothetical protein